MTEQQAIEEFLRGQADCKNGVAHMPNQSKDYDRGYAAQYQLEQQLNELIDQKLNEFGGKHEPAANPSRA